jgi:uncharacterized protein YdaU (DUF1376 family)
MNYWPRWINAIRKRTAELSLIEMGAYDRLLDHYYAEEKPLPGDFMRCCRLAGAVTKQEQDAVRYVLDKFFVLENDSYRQERADEELLIGKRKIDAAQANGKTGGRPRGSTKKPSAKPAGFSEGTQRAPQDESSPSPSVVGGEPSGSPPTASGDCFGEYIPPEDQPLPGVAYGQIAGAIRRAGLASLDPGYPAFRTLVDAGATAAEFTAFVPDALTKDQPFKWLIGAVSGERKRAARMAGELHRGPLPNKQEAIEQRNRAVGEEWAREQLEAMNASR